MILHFEQALVRTLLAHSEAASARRPAFGQTEPSGPGLWLIGDEGVYLMSNGLPGLLRDAGDPTSTRNLVCYGAETNPETLGRDRADDAKRASFGGDDGVEFLAAADLRNALSSYPDGEKLALDVTSETIGILLFQRPKRAAPAGGRS